MAQAVLPGMRARGRGRLLFVSSVAGRIVLPPGAAYAATKWALEALVEALAIETAPLGIADAAEAPTLPLRIPLGQVAAEILAVRRAAPDDRPFIPGAPAAARLTAFKPAR